MLTPLFIFNFTYVFVTTMELSSVVKVLMMFVVFVMVELEVAVMVWQDVTIQLPIRGWDGPMKNNFTILIKEFEKDYSII